RQEDMAAGTLEWNIVPRAPGLEERIQLDLRRLHADAVLQATNQIEIVIAAVQPVGWIEPERQPYLGAVVRDVGAGWHDAEDFASSPVDLHCLSDQRLPAKCRLPQLVREDDDGGRRQLLIGGLTRCGRRCR